MLQNILNAMVNVLLDRGFDGTHYCGWGTTIDTLIEEYYDTGGEYRMVKQVEDLADFIVRTRG